MKNQKKTPSQKIITGDPFLDSLHTLAPSDIDSKIPKKKVSGYVGPLVRLGVLLVCVTVLVASLLSIAASLADYRNADSYYGELAGMWGDSGGTGGNPFGPLNLAYKIKPTPARLFTVWRSPIPTILPRWRLGRATLPR
ncbi:MAG: hypothetical protein IJ955_03470 [Oscillospiraceae bacterium]|nr:hypothetical protein [Oscillospiraceae bacterium]